jgi:hypothetical protein
MDHENLLWTRTAALRALQIPTRGERAHVAGDRFQVQVSGSGTGQTENVRRASRLLLAPSCRGVIGEIVVKRPEPTRRARIATRPGIGPPVADWRRPLVAQEAERLARLQPERRSSQPQR